MIFFFGNVSVAILRALSEKLITVSDKEECKKKLLYYFISYYLSVILNLNSA